VPLAVAVAVPALGQEPQADRDTGIEEQLLRQRDDAVDEVGLDEPLTNLALPRLLGRQRPVSKHEPGRTGR